MGPVTFFALVLCVMANQATSVAQIFPVAPQPSYQNFLSAPGAITYATKLFVNGWENNTDMANELLELSNGIRNLVQISRLNRLVAPLIKDGEPLDLLAKFNGDSPSEMRWNSLTGAAQPNDDDTTSAISPEHAVVEALKYMYEAMSQNNETSKVCINDTGHLLVSILARREWALKFLDASGKPGPGLSQIRINFVGDYSLCRSLVVPPDNDTAGYSGSYNTLKASVGPPSNIPFTLILVQWGVCMPSTCTKMDNTRFLSEALEMANLTNTLYVMEAETHTEERHATGATIVSIVVGGIIVFLMVGGTLYDLLCFQGLVRRSQQDGELNPHNGEEQTPLLGKVSDSEQPRKPAGKIGQIFLAFSVYTNAAKILNTKQAPGSITCVHGIRFLSMSWVTLGHTFLFGLGQTINAATIIPKFEHSWSFTVVSNAFVSVDTFFTLSGILTAYMTLKEMRRRGWKINWGLFYFHRYWRLTPPYMLSLLLVLGLQQYFGQGALWPETVPADAEVCREHWWTNLLYIQNFVHNKFQCYAHAWYLADDMQFFWISPLLIVPFYFNKWLGLAVNGIVWLICAITTGLLSTKYQWPINLILFTTPGFWNYFTDYYIAPWCRIGPFIVGVVCGYLLVHRPRRVFVMSKPVVLIGWLVATATGLAAVYGLQGDISGEHPSSVRVTALYNALARSAWGACVCWVIIACEAGWGGFINTLLSWSPFVVLGRLSYMAYLINPCVIYTFYYSQQTLIFQTEINYAVTFMGILFATYGAAFLLMLGLESPMIGLEKALIGKRK